MGNKRCHLLDRGLRNIEFVSAWWDKFWSVFASVFRSAASIVERGCWVHWIQVVAGNWLKIQLSINSLVICLNVPSKTYRLLSQSIDDDLSREKEIKVTQILFFFKFKTFVLQMQSVRKTLTKWLTCLWMFQKLSEVSIRNNSDFSFWQPEINFQFLAKTKPYNLHLYSILQFPLPLKFKFRFNKCRFFFLFPFANFLHNLINL